MDQAQACQHMLVAERPGMLSWGARLPRAVARSCSACSSTPGPSDRLRRPCWQLCPSSSRPSPPRSAGITGATAFTTRRAPIVRSIRALTPPRWRTRVFVVYRSLGATVLFVGIRRAREGRDQGEGCKSGDLRQGESRSCLSHRRVCAGPHVPRCLRSVPPGLFADPPWHRCNEALRYLRPCARQ